MRELLKARPLLKIPGILLDSFSPKQITKPQLYPRCGRSFRILILQFLQAFKNNKLLFRALQWCTSLAELLQCQRCNTMLEKEPSAGRSTHVQLRNRIMKKSRNKSERTTKRQTNVKIALQRA